MALSQQPAPTYSKLILLTTCLLLANCFLTSCYFSALSLGVLSFQYYTPLFKCPTVEFLLHSCFFPRTGLDCPLTVPYKPAIQMFNIICEILLWLVCH